MLFVGAFSGGAQDRLMLSILRRVGVRGGGRLGLGGVGLTRGEGGSPLQLRRVASRRVGSLRD